VTIATRLSAMMLSQFPVGRPYRRAAATAARRPVPILSIAPESSLVERTTRAD
jgi:hypothetical protein